jgi:hypothetical protein
MEGHQLETHVCGFPLEIQSQRTALVLSPEALGSAFLLPAATKSKSLKGDSIDATWLDGAGKILAQAKTWWGWHAQSPRFKHLTHAAPSNSRTGLAFSLGVDSFYSCFFAKPEPDLLILAAGFDIPVEQKKILLRMQNSVAAVAEATGKDWTMITTNLRQHRLYRKSSWNHTHGGAVAFLGHLLERHISTMLISSSYEANHLGPWGSHPDLDAFWSSSRVGFLHVGQDTVRSDKLRRLVHHPVAAPLVQRHLQVCWESPSEEGNCGCCHKCVMTRINLHRDAPGFHLDHMPDTVPLAEAIEALPPITNELSLNFRRELVGCPDPKVEQALQDMIRRSEAKILSQCNKKSTIS